MVLHVLFTRDGIPGWIGSEPIAGSEPIEDLDVAFLAAHRRTTRGNWVARAKVVPAEPSAEELAARAEAAAREAAEARDAMLRAALADEADPVFFRWQREEASREDWLAAVAAVKARFPKA